jgi:hypothetical protein
VAVANKCTSITGYFDSHGNAMVRYCAHLPMEEVQGLNAAIGQLLALYCPGGHQGDSKRYGDAK